MTTDLRARIDELEERVQIGSGEAELADALRNVLTLCEDRERTGVRSLTTRMVRDAIAEAVTT